MKNVTRSVRMRLALWYAAVLALSVLAFALVVYLLVQASLTGQLQTQLNNDFAGVADILRHDPGEIGELEDHGIAALFWVAEGEQIVYRTAAWRNAGLREALTARRNQHTWRWSSPERTPYYLKAGEIAEADPVREFVVARDARFIHQSLRSLALTLFVGFPLVLALAALGGYFLAGRVLSPVGAMAAKTREISAENLADRLPVDNPDDEFGQLAAVFNEMLSRLERSFDQLRRFTADASHQLRTPLTAIRSVGEVGLQKEEDANALRNVIGSMLEESDRLTGIVDALLTVTRSEMTAVSLTFARVDLRELTNEVVDLLHVLAEEKGQTISVHGEAETAADADRSVLRQAVVNLLDNAIKYSGKNGKIALSVGKTATGRPFVEVRDEGAGIAPDQREMVFERFYRVETGLSDDIPGVGLGLAIARWAAEAHGGRIELDSEVGRGSVFRLVLPTARRKGAVGDDLPIEPLDTPPSATAET